MRIPSLEATLPLEGEHVTLCVLKHDVRPYTGIRFAQATSNTVQNDRFSSVS